MEIRVPVTHTYQSIIRYKCDRCNVDVEMADVFSWARDGFSSSESFDLCPECQTKLTALLIKEFGVTVKYTVG